ncbi:MAG: hypothetical protein JWQ04_2518 [Pedosphaera sp.]|nr:hypothetical protein [Pedosphaera sp.]
MLREINSHDWADFCHRVTQQRQGASVRIETILPNGLKTEQVGDATFQSMELDTSNSCNDVILLRVRSEREIAYDIIDPVHLMLRETRSGEDFNPIQIEAENGTTFLTFHPAIHAQMLAGLKVN